MADSRTLKSRCLCGQASYDITLSESVFPLKAKLCHCDSCRHTTGTLCYTDVVLPEDYRPDPGYIAKLIKYEFSQRLTQYHCGNCGSFIFSSGRSAYQEGDSQPVSWHISTGTLDKFDEVMEIESHIYVEDSKDGGVARILECAKPKPLPFWSGRGDISEQLPDDWKHTESKSEERSDKLHAYCKCGGMEFWIHRRPAALAATVEHQPRPAASSNGEMCSPALAEWLRAKEGKYPACFCVCNSCRLAVGHEITEWVYVPTVDISLDPEGQKPFSLPFGSVKMYKSSPRNERYFCSTCGAMAFFKAEGREGFIDVAVGLLDASEGALASDWIEWQTQRIGFPEDAVGRSGSLVRALENGLRRGI